MVLLSEIRREATHGKSVRCLILGLDNAGKSTLVTRFFAEDINEVAPTVGFQIRTKRVGPINVDFWDVGGQRSLRPFWSNYFHAADALIWVVDSSDLERILMCRDELKSVLREERMTGADLMVVANKQDVADAMSVDELRSALEMERMDGDRWWRLVGCSASQDSSESIRSLFFEILENVRARRFPDTSPLTLADTLEDQPLSNPISEGEPPIKQEDSQDYWAATVPTRREEWGFEATFRQQIFVDNPPLSAIIEETRQILSTI